MMKPSATLKLTAAGLLVLAAALFHSPASSAAPASYTLTFYNDSKDFTIFPVISTPTNGPDQWLQAGFQVPDPATSNRKYAHDFVYRIYVNYPTGILPDSHVTVTLPFWSQLVGSPADGTVPDQFIDWWNGGRVGLYESDRRVTSAPPPLLVRDHMADQANPVTPIGGSPLPMCDDCQIPSLAIYKGTVALPTNDPDQLMEYTLGGIDPTKNPYTFAMRHEVDYDVSYVDHAYLPLALGPHFPSGVSEIGYIGSAQPIRDFRPILEKFLDDNPGWPRYLDAERKDNGKPFLRIPGAYNSVLAIPNDPGSVIEQPGTALSQMKKLWSDCVGGAGAADICGRVRDLNGFFKANYANYHALVEGGQCNPPPPYGRTPQPTLDNLLSKVYGWVQWNEHCTGGAAANDLSQTPGYAGARYAKIHREYINLQYTSLTATPLETFNPYLKLIHGSNYLNMPGSYAFSIDDDVGNMRVEDADGIIFTVGGTKGLQNEDPYNPANVLNVNLGDPKPIKRPAWATYGTCRITDRQLNPGQLSFQVAVPPDKFPCEIRLTDAQNRSYRFTVKTPYPYPPTPSRTPITNCTAPKSTTGEVWCATVTVKTVPSDHKSYLEAAAPVSSQ